ncbi:hypothetical protein PSN45_003846 [Yamadazyma tenuis]|uniref:Uncharacterized protein n=1 Tax=Candida tenuis (strain ATCC 10573 / BCRC 21748 / CBS 615 / JCM 9827 / NBRC 10315 / NRRL Y-1498 / VKM Y-70) TaxID=590646 RepID=G3B322_CANTC|nr:uncharacterized protein CANTEDRAFT_114095 [Yamadazyma tenuis ATCC 10573]EGV64061.1 hypothetical protein CANTEDRAFT_114095 [Yamadazyma tenuis ATCC 10573]WEJ96309.1 hypothetical protein PSN45_003846 [Yamadazyma tenuis]
MTQTIKPGEGLNALKINDGLYSVLDRFKHEQLNLMYSSKDYLNTPIRLQIKNWGMTLLFQKDKLTLIEIQSFSCGINYSYNNINLNSLGSGITLKVIYNKVFGPTYPGKFINNYYILSYPGVSFKFDLSAIQSNKGFDPSLAYLLNSDKDVVCGEIFIFNSNSFDEFLHSMKTGSAAATPASSELSSITEVSQTCDPSFKVSANIKLGVIRLSFRNKEFLVTIGKTTQQEVLNFLGPPDDYFNKFDSRLLIHSNFFKRISTSHTSNKILKFHNYFKFGVDFLYDLNGNGVLSKVILHNGNIVESSSFSHWNKCNYEIYLGNDSSDTNPFDSYDMRIGCSHYFDQIPADFFAGGSKTPILLNRSESELINLDVIPINESNDWGQSKLYCFDHCIWEVLSNDCVSCVTIY